MPVNFLIKHRSGGKYFHPSGGDSNPSNGTNIVLHGDVHANMHWTFDKVTEHWGYIRHVSSGKIIHPSGGSLNPGNDTRLVLHSDRHWGALFALDEVNNYVIHKGGRFAHPAGGSPGPGNGTEVVLHSSKHDAMRFQFVSTNEPHTEVSVYGKPTVLGKWKIIYAVFNPRADHSQTLEIKVGRSHTESTTSTFKYRWEMSTGINLEFVRGSASQTVESMLEKTSSSTWSEEQKVSKTIHVFPGKSVVTWQYVFDVTQNDSRSVFHSDLLADTESEDEEPRELHHAVYKA